MSTTLLPDWLGRAAGNAPKREALVFGGERVTFAELDRRATAMARRLAAVGVREGTQVALLAGNGLEYAEVVHALGRLGAALVPLNTRLTAEELAWQLADVGAGLLLVEGRQAEQAADLGGRLPQLPRFGIGEAEVAGATPLSSLTELATALRGEIDLEATQAIVYTSGTTGRPKGAIITWGMQWWSAVGSALHLGLREDDHWLACLPFFHVGGLSLLMKSAIYGMPLVVHERFEAAAVNAAIVDERVTLISVVTAMLRRMLDALDAAAPAGEVGRYPAWLRCVLLGGGPAPRTLLEDCARRSIPVAQTYGLTESCSQATTLTPAHALRNLGSAGRPLAPVQVRIVAENRREAAPHEAGEIELRGPTITPGYYGRPEATAEALRDGWLRTGDLGYLDEEGYLYVLDRRDDLIVSGGENVYPAEIEAALLAHPDVLEAGVRGMPDAAGVRVSAPGCDGG
jgi:o-succinylbenzoate---CoA ligase